MQLPMRQHRSSVFKLSVMVFMLCLGSTGTGQALAAMDPYDEHSVSMGAQLYELYCSECHGVDTTDRYGELYGSGEMDVSDDYAELVDLVRGVKDPEPYLAPEEDWPEWADNPAPEPEVDVREEVLGTVTSAIDKVHGASLQSDTVGDWNSEAGYGNAKGFDPVPGATNHVK